MKRFIVMLVAVLLLGFACAPSLAEPTQGQTSFDVPPGQKYSVAVDLRAGGQLEGSFSVSGAQDYIDFYVRGPNGELTYGVVRVVGSQGFQVKAAQAGAYTMVFDNSFSFGAGRRVALRYLTR